MRNCQPESIQTNNHQELVTEMSDYNTNADNDKRHADTSKHAFHASEPPCNTYRYDKKSLKLKYSQIQSNDCRLESAQWI